MVTRDGKFLINITYNCFFSFVFQSNSCLVFFPLSAPEIPTTDGKLASTLLRIALFRVVLVESYFIAIILKSLFLDLQLQHDLETLNQPPVVSI